MRNRLSIVLCAALALCATGIEAATVPASLYGEMQWRVIGPFRGGRTRNRN